MLATNWSVYGIGEKKKPPPSIVENDRNGRLVTCQSIRNIANVDKLR